MAFEPVWRSEETDFLAKTLLTFETEDDANRLLDDLCTMAEIKALAQRLAVARLLAKDTTYNTIVASTGASTTTISRVKRCLLYGAEGYRRVLRKLGEEIVHG